MSKCNEKSIINFYREINQKKYHIVDKKESREVSEAEQTILECIIALGIYSEYNLDLNYNLIIQMLFAKSYGNATNKLILCEQYELLRKMYKLGNSKEAYMARLCTDLSKNINYDTLEEKEVYRLFNNYNILRNTIRQGHIYWGAKGNRLESILEHIYGTCALIMGMQSEYDCKLSYSEIIRMLLLHETEEIKIGDLTAWDGVSPEEKLMIGKNAVNNILGNLKKSKEYIDLLDDFNAKMSLSSIEANLCDKIEYDLQVKMYELMGMYNYENVPSNVVTNSSSVRKIMNNGAKGVFDVHYEYDKYRYSNNESFRDILEEAKQLKLR